jgi:large subunit ribosomal protein L28
MGRSCSLTGKRLRFGHNVSHSNRKTNRRFLPNIQRVSLRSEALRRTLQLNVSTRRRAASTASCWRRTTTASPRRPSA